MRISILLFGVLLCLLGGCGGGSGSPSLPVTVSAAPATASLAPAATQTFTAKVANTGNTAVTWSVQEGAVGGTITSAGLYTAPATAGTYHVIATSQAASTKTAVVTVTVHIVVAVTPVTTTITLGQTQAFTAAITGTTNQAVTWTIQEGATGGSITSFGVYTAPFTPGTYHIVATSQADTTQQNVAIVVVQSGSASGIIQ